MSAAKHIEITPVCSDGEGLRACQPDEADMWGVYLRLEDGRAMHIPESDYESKAKARGAGKAHARHKRLPLYEKWPGHFEEVT